ncbi:keratin-associated protein 7-1, partial [Daubentonia madagascariensis]
DSLLLLWKLLSRLSLLWNQLPQDLQSHPLNCVVPLGSPLNYGFGCNGYSSLGYGFGGSNINDLSCCYGGSFYRPWGSGSGFGYSTY